MTSKDTRLDDGILASQVMDCEEPYPIKMMSLDMVPRQTESAASLVDTSFKSSNLSADE